MKQNKFYPVLFILAITVVFSACKKWLDVKPQTQLSEDEQFSSRQGFVDVLFGVYQKAGGTASYGNNLSFGLLDVLAQRYENKSSTTAWYGNAARYNYDYGSNGTFNVRTATDSIWQNNYAAIAQANYILKNVDGGQEILGNTSYSIIKGESLALRAFLHFDLLRLFAPAFINGNSSPAIPYMESFTVVPQQKLTISGVLDKCEQDLKNAEELLSVNKDIDQIAGNQNATSGDLFLMYRQNHLNFWAVKATLARLYQYKGDKVNALKYATEVINSGKFHFITQNEINSDPTSLNADLTFTPEHIFSIYVSGLKDISNTLFKSTTTTTGDPSDLFSRRAVLDDIYEVNITGYGTDIRSPAASKSLWSQISPNIVYTKKFYYDNPSNVKEGLVPVIKLAEMYYIAAEASASAVEGVHFLNEVRTARLIPPLDDQISETLLQDEIEKEYRKEFYGEGQLWFYYKRHQSVNILNGVGNPMNQDKYTFPIPLDEIEFGQ